MNLFIMKKDILFFIISTTIIFFYFKKKVSSNNLLMYTLSFSLVVNVILQKIIFVNKKIEGWSFFDRFAHKVQGVATRLVQGVATRLVKDVGRTEVVAGLVHYTKKYTDAIYHDAIAEIHYIGKSPLLHDIERDTRKAMTFVKKVGKNVESLTIHLEKMASAKLHKIGKDIYKFVKNMLNPCYWLQDIACGIAASSMVMGIEAALSTDGETEVEEVGIDLALFTIKNVIKGISIKSAKKIATGLINKLIVPLLSPILILMIGVLSPNKLGDKIFISDVLSLTSVVLVNELISGNSGLSFTWLMITFVNAFMCTGSWFGIKINKYIIGFKPAILIGLCELGLKCPGCSSKKSVPVKNKSCSHNTDCPCGWKCPGSNKKCLPDNECNSCGYNTNCMKNAGNQY